MVKAKVVNRVKSNKSVAFFFLAALVLIVH